MLVITSQYGYCPLLWIFYGKVLDVTLPISEWTCILISLSKETKFPLQPTDLQRKNIVVGPESYRIGTKENTIYFSFILQCYKFFSNSAKPLQLALNYVFKDLWFRFLFVLTLQFSYGIQNSKLTLKICVRVHSFFITLQHNFLEFENKKNYDLSFNSSCHQNVVFLLLGSYWFQQWPEFHKPK